MARITVSDLPGSLERWGIQLRKGVLDFVVLLSLREKEQYGFELITRISQSASLKLPEGTLYPLLLRLSRDGLVNYRLANGDGGAPRKYYSLSPSGRAFLDVMIPAWAELVGSVNLMISGASIEPKLS